MIGKPDIKPVFQTYYYFFNKNKVRMELQFQIEKYLETVIFQQYSLFIFDLF